MVLYTTNEYFMNNCQNYLSTLYKALFAVAYYGLLQVGEVTSSPHVVKVKDVHLGVNKKKILFVLCSSKTHTTGIRPQLVKIISNSVKQKIIGSQKAWFCPFTLLNDYLNTWNSFENKYEQFFVFCDGSNVHPHHMQKHFKKNSHCWRFQCKTLWDTQFPHRVCFRYVKIWSGIWHHQEAREDGSLTVFTPIFMTDFMCLHWFFILYSRWGCSTFWHLVPWWWNTKGLVYHTDWTQDASTAGQEITTLFVCLL